MSYNSTGLISSREYGWMGQNYGYITSPQPNTKPVVSDQAGRNFEVMKASVRSESSEMTNKLLDKVRDATELTMADKSLALNAARQNINVRYKDMAAELEMSNANTIRELQHTETQIDRPNVVDVVKLWDVTNSRPNERVAIVQHDMEGNPMILKGRITYVDLGDENSQPTVELLGGRGPNIARETLLLRERNGKLGLEERVLNSHTTYKIPLANIHQILVVQDSQAAAQEETPTFIPLHRMSDEEMSTQRDSAKVFGDISTEIMFSGLTKNWEKTECLMEKPSPCFYGSENIVRMPGSSEQGQILQRVSKPAPANIASEVANILDITFTAIGTALASQ